MHKKLREGLGETAGKGQDRNCRKRVICEAGCGGGQQRGERVKKAVMKRREESKRQRPLSIQAREMEDGDVDR